MNEELMITKEDLVNWLNRPPSNDDLDLIGFITTRLENFYKLVQENKQLKEELENDIDRYEDTISYQLGYDNAKAFYEKILTELERALKDHKEIKEKTNTKEYYIEVDEVLDKIQEIKEKYK